MHAWANAADWFWMAFVMVAWMLLIAIVGYAAAVVALQNSREQHWTGRRPVRKA